MAWRLKVETNRKNSDSLIEQVVGLVLAQSPSKFKILGIQNSVKLIFQ